MFVAAACFFLIFHQLVSIDILGYNYLIQHAAIDDGERCISDLDCEAGGNVVGWCSWRDGASCFDAGERCSSEEQRLEY